MARACGAWLRSYARNRSSRLIVCGNFGGPPKPPHSSSCCSRSCWYAAVSVSVPGSSDAGSMPSSALRLTASVSSVRVAEDLVAPVAPRVVDGAAEVDEAWQPVLCVLGEVRAAVERASVRRAEHRHGPAALPGHRLRRGHVDGVDVRPFLAVDLHVHEQLVHHGRGVGVLERLVGHDMAPVARRVTRPRAGVACPRREPRSNASSPHWYQSTGLSRCWRRYGLVASASRFTESTTAYSGSRRSAREAPATSRQHVRATRSGSRRQFG